MKHAWLPPGARFGAGCAREVPDVCRALGIERPLLVTDAGLADSAIVQRVTRTLRRAELDVAPFADVAGNPAGRHVEAGLRALAEGDHDGVVALGGGSALDAGKAIAFAAAQDHPLWDFAWSAARTVEPRPSAPWIAVPTTAGTGSEISPSAVLTDERDGRKHSICHPALRAPGVVCDPELTVGLPARLTAWVGMDALSHNLEAYLSPADDPRADAIAVEALRLVRWALERAVRDGADLEARAAMLAASTMGAAAFVKGCGAVHALSHPLSATFGSHHGLTNAVLLPYVVAFNAPATRDKLRVLARELALPDASPEGVVEWLIALRRALGIPPTLRRAGIAPDDARMDALCAAAAADANAPTNPVPLEPHRIARLYAYACDGRLRAAA